MKPLVTATPPTTTSTAMPWIYYCISLLLLLQLLLSLSCAFSPTLPITKSSHHGGTSMAKSSAEMLLKQQSTNNNSKGITTTCFNAAMRCTRLFSSSRNNNSNPDNKTATTNNSFGKEISPVFYAAAGAPVVDMNQYNLPLDQIVNEWTAVLQPKTSMQEEGIFLQTRTKRGLFVDTLQYKVKRQGGLGLILTEIAGGREDGIGITIVEDIVVGGNAEKSGILPGDSIVALSVFQKSTLDNSRRSMNVGDVSASPAIVREERFDVSTECLGFDATVEALSSLPQPPPPPAATLGSGAEEDFVYVTVKRIRRQPRVNVKLQFPPETKEPDAVLELFAGENLRRAMLTRGVKLNDALSRRFDSGGTGDCGAEGTCATCVVKVTQGMELLSPARQQEAQILSRKPRWRLACKTIVGYGMTEGDMTIQVNPRQWKE